MWYTYSMLLPIEPRFVIMIPTGWWFQPLWKILVSWDDYSQLNGKKKFQTTSQKYTHHLLGEKKKNMIPSNLNKKPAEMHHKSRSHRAMGLMNYGCRGRAAWIMVDSMNENRDLTNEVVDHRNDNCDQNWDLTWFRQQKCIWNQPRW